MEPDRYTITQTIAGGKVFYQLFDHINGKVVSPTVNNQWRLHFADGTAKQMSIKPIIRQIYDAEYCIDEIPDLNDGEHGEEQWFFVDDKYISSL